MTKAANFPPTVAGDLAVPYSVALSDYSILKFPSDTFNQLDIKNQREVLDDLARRRLQFQTLANDISYILLHQAEFQSPDPTTLAAWHDEVVAALNTMQKEASACVANPGACTFTAFDIAKFPLPNHKAPAGVVFLTSNPAAKVLTEGAETILRKDLNGWPHYGQADGAADILYTGQQCSWEFDLPTKASAPRFAPEALARSFLRISVITDDHYTRPLNDYAIAIDVNGQSLFSGKAGLPHGAPLAGPFSNWVKTDYPFKFDPTDSKITVTVTNGSMSDAKDWIALDWIEVHFVGH
jgi:hypothetical protein